MKENHFVINFRKKMKIQKTPCFSSPGIIVPAFLLTKISNFLLTMFCYKFCWSAYGEKPFWTKLLKLSFVYWIKLFRRRNIKNTLLIPTRNNYISLFVDKQWIDCFCDTCHLNIFLKIFRQISYLYCSCCKFCWNAYGDKPFRTKSLKPSLVWLD